MEIIFVVKLAVSLFFSCQQYGESLAVPSDCAGPTHSSGSAEITVACPWSGREKDWEVSVPSCPSPWAGQDQELMWALGIQLQQQLGHAQSSPWPALV